MFTPVKVGIIGCGTISGIYLKNAQWLAAIDVIACADIRVERARSRAEEYGISKACSVADLLADPDIEIVLNLTPPSVHAEIAQAALQSGKSVYNEKPLAISREESQRLIEIATGRGLRVGCAPDTFLGGGLQTCRKLIDDGAIGEPIAAVAFMMNHGAEHWHPDPAFFYHVGAGPMFDTGPYYLTALVNLIGPIRRVVGSTRMGSSTRTITSQPHYGQIIRVEVPTYVAGLLEFASGAVGTIITSFDVWGSTLPRAEIYGSEGSLGVPDPNTFRGPVRLSRAGQQEWQDVPLSHGYVENSRGVGVADMAVAMRVGRSHRASAALAYHILDVMHAIHDAARTGTYIDIGSTCDRPAPLPLGLEPGQIDS